MADFSSFISTAASSAAAGLRALIREAFLSEFNRPIRVQVGQDRVSAVPLLAHSFHARESVCAAEPLRLEIVGLSAQNNLSPAAFMGQPVRVQMVTDSGQLRAFSAIVTQAQSLPDDGSGGQPWLLEAVDVMTLKRQTRRSRILKSKSVIDAIEVVLKEWVRDLGGCFAYNFDHLELGKYAQRGSFFQIDESDTDFIQRHCRKHGIGWAVKTARNSVSPVHTLVFFDASAKFEANAAGSVRYHADSATEARDVITVWSPVGRMRPGVVEGQSWDYKVQRTSQHQSPTVINYGEQGNRVADSLLEAQIHPPRWADDDEEYGRMGDLRMQYHEMQAAFVKGAGGSRDAEVLTWIEVKNRPGVGLARSTGNSPYANTLGDTGANEYLYLQVEHWGRNNLPKELDEWVKAVMASNGWHMSPPNIGHYQDKRRYTNTFTAVEFGTPVVPEFIPERDWPRLASMIGVVVCPEGEEVHCDEYARVFVRIPGLRVEDHDHADGAGTSGTPADSMPIRVAMPAANAGGGMLQLPRKDDEVLITFINGDPDKPIITHAIHSPVNTPTSFHGINTLPGNRYLSGNRSQEIAGDNATHVLHDNTPQQTNVQMHADHSYSQLTLGYITTPRSEGKASPRGEGVELRTDAAAAFRAAEGVLISAWSQLRAKGNQLDVEAALSLMQTSMDLFKSMGEYAAKHKGFALKPEAQNDLAKTLHHWQDGTNTTPDKAAQQTGIVAITAPEGIAHTTNQSLLHTAGQNIDSIASKDIQHVAGGQYLTQAGHGIGMFSHDGGMQLISHQGPLQLQSQSASTTIESAQNMTLAAKNVQRITGKVLEFVAYDGSFIRLGDNGITLGTNGPIQIHSASFSHAGPKILTAQAPAFSVAPENPPQRYSQRLNVAALIGKGSDDSVWKRLSYDAIDSKGKVIAQGSIDDNGTTSHIYTNQPEELKVAFKSNDGWMLFRDVKHDMEDADAHHEQAPDSDDNSNAHAS